MTYLWPWQSQNDTQRVTNAVSSLAINNSKWSSADRLLLHREAKVEMLRRAGRVLSMPQTVSYMPLLNSKAYGPPTQKESAIR